jgi:hypothetical protein
MQHIQLPLKKTGAFLPLAISVGWRIMATEYES